MSVGLGADSTLEKSLNTVIVCSSHIEVEQENNENVEFGMEVDSYKGIHDGAAFERGFAEIDVAGCYEDENFG